MTRFIPVALLLFALPIGLAAQELSLSTQSPTGDNTPGTYALQGGEVQFQSNSMRFLHSGLEIAGVEAWGVSPGLSVVALVQSGGTAGSRALIMNAAGDTLLAYGLPQLSAGEESLALFPGDDGSLWVRSNVSSFTRHDVFGTPSLSLSAGSQGTDGATMPQVSTDPSGKTVLIYTTQIRTGGGGLGSGAWRLTENRELESVHYSSDRTISYAGVTEDGQFIILVTRAEGTDDRVRIMDRYGNTITTVTTEEELAGANLSGDTGYLVAWSPGRAIVYSTLTGERVRSASFRRPLFHAQYFPEDETIIGLTGEYFEQTGLMNGAGFYAIDLGAGQIASRELGAALGFSGSFKPRFQRTGSGSYLLLGASRQVEIRTGF